MIRGLLAPGAWWRLALLISLYALPVVALAGFGIWYLNVVLGAEHGWVPWATWGGMVVCFLAAVLLGARLTRKGSRAILDNPSYDDPLNYWTDRDIAAWKVVETHAANLKPPKLDQLSDPNTFTPYSKEAQELALKVAQIYVPGTKDPLGHLTFPEILTMAELVATDMSELVDKYIPGSSVLTVGHLKQARKAADYYQTASNIYWVVSAALNPIKTVVQYATSQLGLQSGMAQIQNNVLHWFFLTFVHQFGRYLIELNSGRLKVGAKRYRELMAKHQAPTVGDAADAPTPNPSKPLKDEETHLEPQQVTVAVVGPVKAGKSSLINAIFGEQRTAVAQTPLTAASTKYVLNQKGMQPLTIVDTVGFGVDGPTDADIANAMVAATTADILILAVPARSAARAPEVSFLERVRDAFARQPQLKMPPVVVAMTHIDQLTPAMEWAPPYHWDGGARPKEKSIHDALAAVKEAFAGKVVAAVPVCGAAGKEYNVREGLMPAVATHLGTARGVSLLRMLHLEGMIDHTKKAIGQLLNVGKGLWNKFIDKKQ